MSSSSGTVASSSSVAISSSSSVVQSSSSSSVVVGINACPNAVTESGKVTCGGKVYKTVVIGEAIKAWDNPQTWMAENLNYDAPGSKCYDNSEDNCDIYGRLYDWKTAKAVCPQGWHLPSDAEWTTLTDYVESQGRCTGCAGTRLKSTSGWNGLDTHGFSALPGGYGSGTSFVNVGDSGNWWSSTEYESYSYFAYNRGMYYGNSNVNRNEGGKEGLLSVRCVQD